MFFFAFNFQTIRENFFFKIFSNLIFLYWYIKKGNVLRLSKFIESEYVVSDLIKQLELIGLSGHKILIVGLRSGTLVLFYIIVYLLSAIAKFVSCFRCCSVFDSKSFCWKILSFLVNYSKYENIKSLKKDTLLIQYCFICLIELGKVITVKLQPK